MQGVGPKGEIIWINDVMKIAWVCFVSLVAIFAFASALQGYFADNCNWGERALLMVVSIAAFRPSLITGFTGGPRPVVQLLAVAVFAALYWYQHSRRKGQNRHSPRPPDPSSPTKPRFTRDFLPFGSRARKGCGTLGRLIGAWRSLVARLLWEQEVGGSNPLAPTREKYSL